MGDKQQRLLEKTFTELILQNKKLIESAQAEREFRDTITRAANSTYSIDEFLQKVFPNILDIMDASRGSIALRSQDPLDSENQLYIATHSGISDNSIMNRVINSDNAEYIKRALTSGNQIIITETNDQYSTSSIVIPFGWKNEYQGAVCVSSKEDKYTKEDAQLLSNCVKDLEIQVQHILEKIRNIQVYIACVEARDPYTATHNVRVGQLARLIASECRKSIAEQYIIGTYGSIHDIGKIGIPDVILLKEEKLDDEEWRIMKGHTVAGEQMLIVDVFSIYGKAILRNHHEKWSGSGYPDLLFGENIPEVARIVAIADAFDAMNSKRCYRDRLDENGIIEELREGKGMQFDPFILQVFLDVLPSIVYTEARKDKIGILFHRPFCEYAQRIPQSEFVVGKRANVEQLEAYSPCPDCFSN